MNIILASASPRRRELLERMGIEDFDIIVSDCDGIVILSSNDHEKSLRKIVTGKAISKQRTILSIAYRFFLRIIPYLCARVLRD